MSEHASEFRDWQLHPTTQGFAEDTRLRAANALAVLLGTARGSSDPKVTKAVQLFDTLSDLHRTLTEKAREEDEADPTE